jgi:hypothetical protein
MNIHQIRQAGVRAMEDAVVASLPPEMRNDAPSRPKLSKWIPTTDLMTLRRMGKLAEELGELQAVVARCVIQGIDEVDPGSHKVNRQRLLDELSDVQAQIGRTLLAFDLDQEYLQRRVAEKMRQMNEWEAMFQEDQ